MSTDNSNTNSPPNGKPQIIFLFFFSITCTLLMPHTAVVTNWIAFIQKIKRDEAKVLTWQEDNLRIELKKQGFEGVDAEDLVEHW